MVYNQKIAELWNQMVTQVATDNKISRCQASSLALQGLLFLDDVEKSGAVLPPVLLFKDLEQDILDTIFRELNNTCVAAT